MSDHHPYDDLHQLAALYAVDALEPAERAAFESHLDDCPRCRDEIAGYAEVGALLAEAVAQEPPAALRAAVLSAISPKPEAEVVPLEVRRRRRTRRLLVAAAAAVLAPGLALGGWGLGVQSEQRQQQHSASQQQASEDRLLAAPDLTTHRMQVQGQPATLFVSRQQDAALLVSTNLPDSGQGSEYQLWLIKDAAPVPDVHFTSRQTRIWLDGDIATARAVAMTIEPAGGSKTPTLPLLAVALI